MSKANRAGAPRRRRGLHPPIGQSESPGTNACRGPRLGRGGMAASLLGIERNGLLASAVSIRPDLSRISPKSSDVYRTPSSLKPNRFGSDAGPAVSARAAAPAAQPRSTARLAQPSTAAPSKHRPGATPLPCEYSRQRRARHGPGESVKEGAGRAARKHGLPLPKTWDRTVLHSTPVPRGYIYPTQRLRKIHRPGA